MEKETAEIMRGLLQKALDEITPMTNSGARKGLAPQQHAQKLSRTWAFDHYIKPSLAMFAKWLENSNENTNYTYDLTTVNKYHLAGFVDTITGCSIERALSYMDELLLNEPLRHHINEFSVKDPDGGTFVDRNMGYGRRLGWYAIIRATKPGFVIETGVEKGVGSVVMAAALLLNRKEGYGGDYLGTDINPKAGFLFDGIYASCGRIVYGDSIETLKAIDRTIDLVINDSDHSAGYESQEYEAIGAKLSAAAIILGDNAHTTSALFDFAIASRRKFLFFAEKPADHFYPGAGIGAAFVPPTPASSAGHDRWNTPSHRSTSSAMQAPDLPAVSARLPALESANSDSRRAAIHGYVSNGLPKVNAILPTVYASYEEALSHCGQGYSDVVLNAVRFCKAANIIQQLLGGATADGLIAPVPETIGMFKAICSDPSHRYRILDFGGGFAMCYFFLRQRTAHNLRWAVVETPLTASMGRAFESEDLRFFDTIDAARAWLGEVDAVHTNAALQYQASPEATLESLASVGAQHFALLRCALTADNRAIQLQESPLSDNHAGPLPGGVADRPVWYPHTSVRESDFIKILTKANYAPLQASGHTISVADRAAASVNGLHDCHFLHVRGI